LPFASRGGRKAPILQGLKHLAVDGRSQAFELQPSGTMLPLFRRLWTSNNYISLKGRPAHRTRTWGSGEDPPAARGRDFFSGLRGLPGTVPSGEPAGRALCSLPRSAGLVVPIRILGRGQFHAPRPWPLFVRPLSHERCAFQTAAASRQRKVPGDCFGP